MVRDPYARWCGRGGTARCPPIPIFHPSRPFAVGVAKGNFGSEGLLSERGSHKARGGSECRSVHQAALDDSACIVIGTAVADLEHHDLLDPGGGAEFDGVTLMRFG